jgi:acyl-coenzyme A thioesterase PaaI-like protein
VNPDQILLRRFLAHPHAPLAIDSNPMGVALRAELLGRENGTIRIGFQPGREFLQGNGALQGGIVATMLDFASAFAAFAAQAVPLIATGTVERSGRRLIFARAQLEQAQHGVLLASASAVMSVLDAAIAPERT